VKKGHLLYCRDLKYPPLKNYQPEVGIPANNSATNCLLVFRVGKSSYTTAHAMFELN